jgi:hypothetical protein
LLSRIKKEHSKAEPTTKKHNCSEESRDHLARGALFLGEWKRQQMVAHEFLIAVSLQLISAAVPGSPLQTLGSLSSQHGGEPLALWLSRRQEAKRKNNILPRTPDHCCVGPTDNRQAFRSDVTGSFLPGPAPLRSGWASQAVGSGDDGRLKRPAEQWINSRGAHSHNFIPFANCLAGIACQPASKQDT